VQGWINALAPDGGFNGFADWGPVVSSIEGGQPTGVACYPSFTPRLGCQNDSNGNASGACCDGNNPCSPHTAGIMVGMGDGSVRFVRQGISPLTWWYAMTPNQGDILGPDW
jgi:hypothetical protein